MFVKFLYVVHTEILIGFLVRKCSPSRQEATYLSTEAQRKKGCGHDNDTR